MKMEVLNDVQLCQRDNTFDKLSAITARQARRRVILFDEASVNEHTIEKTVNQSAVTFMRNFEKVSKLDIRDKKTNIDLKNAEELDQQTPLENPATLKNIGHKANIKVSSPINPVALNAVTHELRPKLRLTEPASDLPAGTMPSKKAAPENVSVKTMQMEVSPIDSFTSLEATAISHVLVECLDQLAILRFTIPAGVDSRWDDSFKTVDKIYGAPDEPVTIFREEMGLLPIVPTEAEKMQRDRNYVYKVLEKVLRDLKENRRFDSLREEINNIAKQQQGERNLKASARMWHNQAEQLRELLESDGRANEDDRLRTIRLAQETDAQVDQALFLNSGKLDYTEKWANARLEQQELKLYLEKMNMLNKLSDCSKEYNAEQIISAEINVHVENDIKEKEERIIEWTGKYNDEIEERQQEIDELRRLIEDQQFEIKMMRTLKKDGRELIDEETRLYNEARRRERLNEAATIIQSLWRGFMVRNKLGKYKYLRRLGKRKKKKKGAKRGK
ncbi:IQ domain-containing protein D-like isoform X2 [Pseudomyrmex gracilis]|uniref:IQ domain-containing protein D-like isoform X2 n=1 Tax=Pseudomyrmex gracilis TaxID=219809 RepID=UPI000994A278|nr:IQ domain-containing protein D-like isoform X2 [Pseudomyrmex gracilis]